MTNMGLWGKIGNKIQDVDYATRDAASRTYHKFDTDYAGPRIKSAAMAGLRKIREEAPGKLSRAKGRLEGHFNKTAAQQLLEIQENERRLALDYRQLALEKKKAKLRQERRQYSSMPVIGGIGGFQPGPIFGTPKKRGRTIWD